MHYAVLHQTASGIIYNKADSEKENIGLTSWSQNNSRVYAQIDNTDNRIMNYFIYYCINFFYNKEGLFIYKRTFLSPSYFNVNDTSAREFILNSEGYPNNNNWVTNDNS